jgi:uncharacterized protein involved in outer membrane biogenesis
MAVGRKRGPIVAGIAAVLLLALTVLVSTLLHLDRYRPQLVAYLQEKTGKEVEIGRLGLSFFPLSIRIDQFWVKNPPLFPRGYVVQVARIDATFSTAALLHRRLVITSLVLEDPVFNLMSDPDGPWNFESPQSTVAQNAIPLDVISRAQIKRGEVVASNLLPSDAPGPIFFEAHQVSCDLKQVNLMRLFDRSASSMDGQGTLKAGILRLGWVETRNLDSTVRLESRHVFFQDVKANVYDGSATGNLSFDLSGQNARFETNGRASGVTVAQLLAAFPHGGGKMTGKIEGDLTLSGEIAHSIRPLAGIRGTGHVTVRNGQIPSLKLNENLMKLLHFNDLGPGKNDPSAFKLIRADLDLQNQRLSSRVVDIYGYGVDADGSGSVSVSGSNELSYRGWATITTEQGFFTNLIARLSGATLHEGKLQFPFHLDGTIDKPVFAKGEDSPKDAEKSAKSTRR